jgi:hypothetical protein
MAVPKFPSKFLKLGSNVEDGDVIRFLDAPTMDSDDKLVCTVGMTEKKKFQVNKTNYKAVALLYGEDCDKWVGKEVQIYEGVANNPSTGQEGPSIKLKAVGGADPKDVNELINR